MKIKGEAPVALRQASSGKLGPSSASPIEHQGNLDLPPASPIEHDDTSCTFNILKFIYFVETLKLNFFQFFLDIHL
jgi:hypothetical protein